MFKFDETNSKEEVANILNLASNDVGTEMGKIFNEYLVDRRAYLEREAEFDRYCNTPCWRYKA